MVSYYNHFAMYQKNPSGANLPYSASPSAWYSPNYHHQPPNPQFLGESDTSPQVYYPHHVFHQSSPDWSGHENYAPPPQSSLLQTSTANGSSGFLPINQTNNNHNHNHNTNNANEHINDGLQSIPSPPITVSGSDMSSPGAPNGSSSPQITTRPTPVKSPFEWMKKPSYQSQPNPGFWRGHPDQQPDATRPRKTRTKDKYRVVYTDHQRLELEKEFHYTRYITIRRKSELAQALALSERQVKIWFQNRRAKDRKQKKKMENGSSLSSNGQSLLSGSHGNSNTSSNLSGLLDVKPKMEPSLHLQHLHHQMGAIGIGMSQMGLHHPHHPLHSHHLAPPPPLPPTSMNQTSTVQQGSTGSTSSLLLG